MEKKGYRKKEAEGRGILSFVRLALHDLTLITKQTVIFAP